MKTTKKPNVADWAELCKRPVMDTGELDNLVQGVFDDVQVNGDEALRRYTKLYDKVTLGDLLVDEQAIRNSGNELPTDLKDAMKLALDNIQAFHNRQVDTTQFVKITEGVECWRESRSITSVGLYIPGGSAPLFSTVLMLGAPAMIAGCKEVVVCTPPDNDGEVNPAIRYACKLLGIRKIIKVGGVQAIAGMTFGTDSVPRVLKIFGPGNQFVTAAKMLAPKYGVAIDLPAGPSELLVIADRTAKPSFVAADLLSQAEHGGDSQVVLCSTSEVLIDQVKQEIAVQLIDMPRKEIATMALSNAMFVVFDDLKSCLAFSNCYGPEHLILAVKNASQEARKVNCAGSVFVGNYSAESAGDYASGTNHALPTNGFAANYSGVSVDSFVKKITFQELSKEGVKRIGPAIELMAEAEGLQGHKNAISIRLKEIYNERIR